MKKVVNFLLIIVMAMFVIACSEDINLTLKDGKDGLNGTDGTNGKDGRDGYDLLFHVDQTANIKVWYQDRNNSFQYDSGDTIFYRETQNGSRIIADGSGCYKIVEINGMDTTVIGNVCNGENGSNGHNGANAYNFVISSRSFGNRDSIGSISGELIDFYLDVDTNGIVSSLDKLQYSIPVYNGVTKVPTFNLTDIGGVYLFTVSVDGVIVYANSIKMAVDGLTPSLEATDLGYGVQYIWYFDLLKNSKYDAIGDSTLSKDIITKAINGHDGKTIHVFKAFYEDCNTLSSYHYSEIGWWILGTPFSINHIDAPVINGFQNGTLVNWDHSLAPDITWMPIMNPMTLHSASFLMGSKETWRVDVFALKSDGTRILVKSDTTTPVSNLVWWNLSTYRQKFTYQWKMDEQIFNDVVRIGIMVTQIGDFDIPNEGVTGWRDLVCNIDNIEIESMEIK